MYTYIDICICSRLRFAHPRRLRRSVSVSRVWRCRRRRAPCLEAAAASPGTVGVNRIWPKEYFGLTLGELLVRPQVNLALTLNLRLPQREKSSQHQG